MDIPRFATVYLCAFTLRSYRYRYRYIVYERCVYNNIQYIYTYYIMIYIFSGGGYVYCGIGCNDFFKLLGNFNSPTSSLSTPLSLTLTPSIFLSFGHFPFPIYLSFLFLTLLPNNLFLRHIESCHRKLGWLWPF